MYSRLFFSPYPRSQMLLSLIIPVYERPSEICELLESLTHQTTTNFEVIVVDDGSKTSCESVVQRFANQLNLQFFFKPNSGPGLSRNYGADRALGDYLIFLDSDCVLPPHYTTAVQNGLQNHPADAFGGPDRAGANFTPIQKAINYSMTSFFTTGGIRGGKKSLGKFHPRSFNMGISKTVYQKTKGFSTMRFGEDVDLSLRILEAGFSTALYPEAWVFHKRRTDFWKFYKQIHNSGIARINLHLRHPGSLKLVHVLPSLWVVVMAFFMLAGIFWHHLLLVFPLFYMLLIFCDALLQTKNLQVAALAIIASATQMKAYGFGFLRAAWLRLVLGKGEFAAFTKNFYK